MITNYLEKNKYLSSLNPGDHIKIDLSGVIIECMILSIGYIDGKTVDFACLAPDNIEHDSFAIINYVWANNPSFRTIDRFASYIGKQYFWAEYSSIIGPADQISGITNKIDGCNCNDCKQYFDYAEPNQTDNSFVCYSCTQNPIRKYY